MSGREPEEQETDRREVACSACGRPGSRAGVLVTGRHQGVSICGDCVRDAYVRAFGPVGRPRHRRSNLVEPPGRSATGTESAQWVGDVGVLWLRCLDDLVETVRGSASTPAWQGVVGPLRLDLQKELLRIHQILEDAS